MEDLVLSIEQCKHLKELGLDMSDAKFTREGIENGKLYIVPKEMVDFYKSVGVNLGTISIPTYTLQEVLNHIERLLKKYEVITYDNTLDGAYKALCKMLEREKDDMKHNLEPTYESGLVFDDIDINNLDTYTIIKNRKKS